MNLYFLVEGKRTEVKVYPKWLGYLLPAFKRVKYPNEAVENNYFLISGNGYPCILNQIITSIEEINELGNYNHLIVCLDAEENTVEEHINSIINKIINKKLIQHIDNNRKKD